MANMIEVHDIRQGECHDSFTKCKKLRKNSQGLKKQHGISVYIRKHGG